MKSGAKPIKRLPSRKFHELYGDVAQMIPDFNLDALLWMPDQDADAAPTECTGYAPDDIIVDIIKQLTSPDWSYANNLFLEGVAPGTQGADPHVAMQARVLWGVLLKLNAPFSAATKGELFCSNYKNWPSTLTPLAAPYAQNGVLDVLGNGDPLSSMLKAAYTNKIGISIASIWYPEWEHLPADSVLPMPADINPTGATWHNYTCKGQRTYNGQAQGRIKSFQGTAYGDGGWCYMPPDVAEAVLSVSGTGALTFDPNAMRIIVEMKIIVEHFFPLLLPQFPFLNSVSSGA